MGNLSLKQLSSLHSRKNHLLLDLNTSTTCDDEKSYLPAFELNDDSDNNDDKSEWNSINHTVIDTDDTRFTINNDKLIFLSQNVQGLRSYLRKINLDAIVQNMIYRNLSVYCIQETWLDGNFIKEIEGYTVFHHGLEKQVCKRS